MVAVMQGWQGKIAEYIYSDYYKGLYSRFTLDLVQRVDGPAFNRTNAHRHDYADLGASILRAGLTLETCTRNPAGRMAATEYLGEAVKATRHYTSSHGDNVITEASATGYAVGVFPEAGPGYKDVTLAMVVGPQAVTEQGMLPPRRLVFSAKPRAAAPSETDKFGARWPVQLRMEAFKQIDPSAVQFRLHGAMAWPVSGEGIDRSAEESPYMLAAAAWYHVSGGNLARKAPVQVWVSAAAHERGVLDWRYVLFARADRPLMAKTPTDAGHFVDLAAMEGTRWAVVIPAEDAARNWRAR